MQTISLETSYIPLFDIKSEMKRLRKMRATKKPSDPNKLHDLWVRLRSRSYRWEWAFAKQHWFKPVAVTNVIQLTMHQSSDVQRQYSSEFIEFKQDVELMKMDCYSKQAEMKCIEARPDGNTSEESNATFVADSSGQVTSVA